MDSTLFITFLLTSFALIIIPGPNILVIVSTSITHGKVRGLQTVAGTSLAMAIQLIIAAVGTSSFVHAVAEGFAIVKWLGVAYLIYLGVMHIKRALSIQEPATSISSTATFYRGFIVSLTNPKTIAFFGAFLPQFVTSSGNYLWQMSVLSVSFLLLAILLDSSYAVLASRFVEAFKKHNIHRLQNGLSGMLFFGASVWLAASRRVQ